MEPAFSNAWFETFGDEEQTEREVAFLLDVLPPPPFDDATPAGETARMQLVFRRR